MRFSVFGGGSWGTALAHQMARKGHEVLLWAYEQEVVEGLNLNHHNPLFLEDLELHRGITASTDLEQVAHFSSTWLWVVPVQFSRGVMSKLTGALRGDVVMISASKGIETTTMRRMDEMAWETLNLPASRFCAISGPTFAREVVLGDPSAAVLACSDPDLAASLQEAFSDHHLRCYAGRDLIGVELAGALKNVVAIAAGIIDGMGLGSNTQAALMTRGLHEMTRFGVAMGADANTFRGLAGMGDLVLTCTGGLSRNRTFGQRIGRGEDAEAILGSMREVVEGARTAPAADALAREMGIEMPITAAVATLLAGRADPPTVLRELMLRDLKVETQL